MERLEKGNQICFINEVSFSLGKGCLNFMKFWVVCRPHRIDCWIRVKQLCLAATYLLINVLIYRAGMYNYLNDAEDEKQRYQMSLSEVRKGKMIYLSLGVKFGYISGLAVEYIWILKRAWEI